MHDYLHLVTLIVTRSKSQHTQFRSITQRYEHQELES